MRNVVSRRSWVVGVVMVAAACGSSGSGDGVAGADGGGVAGDAGSPDSAAGAGGAAGGGGSSAGTGTGGGPLGGTGGAGAGAGGFGGSGGGAAASGAAGAAATSGASGARGASGVDGGAGASGAGGGAGASGADAGADAPPPGTAAACFAGQFVHPTELGPDYDQFSPTIGSHCKGTNHQDIQGVERVVFLGDSVTVGTPPWLALDYYRVKLAGALAQRFGLTPPGLLWNNVNVIDGVVLQQESGDFASCSKWGARTDDFLRSDGQIPGCFTEASRQKKTLVVMTMGGNDVAAITKSGLDGKPIPDIWQDVYQFVQYQREAVTWLTDPVNFPNGSYVVFANMFEFTDGTGDVTACPAAGLAGFGAAWSDPTILADMVIYANEQFMDIAVDTGTDMIFMLESFCGHGFNAADPTSPCYRGPNTPQWFDLTCIHPNPTGHSALADLFAATIAE
ncbi:MAG: hypothetical protein IT376_00345 [Polyangiaceae bacterium]|nr:hypothetical protein [Polyangiaceae bacterium]